MKSRINCGPFWESFAVLYISGFPYKVKVDKGQCLLKEIDFARRLYAFIESS